MDMQQHSEVTSIYTGNVEPACPTCDMGGPEILRGELEEVLDFLRQQTVGRNRMLEGPFGATLKLYADYTASGQALAFVNQYLQWARGMFANSHTEDSATGVFMTHSMESAIRSIGRCTNAQDNFVTLCVGTGCTGAVQRLQQILGVYVPPAVWVKLHGLVALDDEPAATGEPRQKIMDRFPAPLGDEPPFQPSHGYPQWLRTREQIKTVLRKRDELPLVIVGGLEHHSNELSWRDGLCDYERVPVTEDFAVDLAAMERILTSHMEKSPKRPLIGSFSDCSNVTGLRVDVKAMSKLIRRFGGLVFVDYAASGPYVPIDCQPADCPDLLDGCFFSPHKFLGGDGSCGVLLLRKSVYDRKLPPTFGGGGTVKFVSKEFHAYSDDIGERETAGTPGVLQIMQCALAMEVKAQLQPERIEEVEARMLKDFFRWIQDTHPANIFIVGNRDPSRRIPIVSFNVVGPHPLHPRFVTSLLSDLFGVQTRAGCSCAGPHGQDLFKVEERDLQEWAQYIVGTQVSDEEPGIYSVKPGWCRLNLHYTLDEVDIWYLKSVLSFIVKHGHKFLSVYSFDLISGGWQCEWKERSFGRSQSLHAHFANLEEITEHEGGHGGQDKAVLHSFGVAAALQGARHVNLMASRRREIMHAQLQRAEDLLERLPEPELVPPPEPYPKIVLPAQGEQPFFVVAEGMTTNLDRLIRANKLREQQLAKLHDQSAKFADGAMQDRHGDLEMGGFLLQKSQAPLFSGLLGWVGGARGEALQENRMVATLRNKFFAALSVIMLLLWAYVYSEEEEAAWFETAAPVVVAFAAMDYFMGAVLGLTWCPTGALGTCASRAFSKRHPSLWVPARPQVCVRLLVACLLLAAIAVGVAVEEDLRPDLVLYGLLAFVALAHLEGLLIR